MPRAKKKPNYDGEKIMTELLEAVKESYWETGELKLTAAEFEMAPIKIRKLLITAGEYENNTSIWVQELYEKTKSITEVMLETGLSRASVSGYLPYQKMVYKPDELSVHAERAARYRKRKKAIAELLDDPCESYLWVAIVLFEGYQFYTVSGLPFKYEIKRGKSGRLNRELIIDRMKESKTLSWSSIMLAFDCVDEAVVYRKPKELNDSRGISYIFSIFFRFGLIKVTTEIENKLKR